MSVTVEFVETTYPLHYFIWENRIPDLQAFLTSKNFQGVEELEKVDPRGRTPLLLAVTLGNREAARVLLHANANAQFEHTSGWTIVQEAVCGGDPELLKMMLEYRDSQKRSRRGHLIPSLLRRLADAPDFYTEIKFEFSSWVPLLGRSIPGNAHRVYKMGQNLRVDSCTLGGADQLDWTQGITLIFQGRDDCVRMMEIDHMTRQVFVHVILSGDEREGGLGGDTRVYEKTVSHRLSHPAIISYVNLHKIAFQRNKTGMWGWGSDKSELIGSYDCKVFSATNVELVTKMRHEHLSQSDKERTAPKSHLHKILHSFGTTETNEQPPTTSSSTSTSASSTHVAGGGCAEEGVSALQYFDANCDLGERDIGRPKELRTTIHKFKANVWLSENYPLNLQEQVMPIVDIMAMSSSHFQKLKDFIQMQIPSGFPVKIEIPMFHLLTACITFQNIFGTEEGVVGVRHLKEEDSGRLSCILEEELFEPPRGYQVKESVRPGPMNSSDDDLFSWAVNEEEGQGGEEEGGKDPAKMVDIYEALNAPRTLTKDVTPDSDAEEQLLQRAIEESLMMARMAEEPGWKPWTEEGTLSAAVGGGLSSLLGGGGGRTTVVDRSESEEELAAVLDMSRRQEEEEARLRREEDDALNKVLQLSLMDK